MGLSELLKKDMIRKVEPDKQKGIDLLSISKRDLKVAQDNLKEENFDWALAIAYNSMLSAGRALMSIKGYRATSETHHLAVVQYCAAVLPKEAAELVSAFNRYRSRRRDVVYGESESVGKDEAVRALEKANRFFDKINELVG